MKKFIATIALSLGVLGLAGCKSDATVASHNVSKASDNFEVNRRIVFLNGITNEYIMTINGRCSIVKDNVDSQLEVTCKVGDGQFKKHFLGVSDNVTYFVEHLQPTDVSVYHYRVIFKPQTVIPEIDLKGNWIDLTKDRH